MLDDFALEFRSGSIPTPFTLAGVFNGIELACGEITVLGAPPSTGKTAMALQIVFELLAANPDVPVYIANAESSFRTIAIRELSRRTKISGSRIRRNATDPTERESIEEALSAMRSEMRGFRWLDGEVGFASLNTLRGQPPGVIVIDYLQKFVPGGSDLKTGIASLMSLLRSLAFEGWCVLCLSATNRASNGDGKAGMAAFRDSSEIEFNADAAYVLEDEEPESQGTSRKLKLRCVKNRHGSRDERLLTFNAEHCSFEFRNDFAADFMPDCFGGSE
jgi:replicative DNA helicase